MENNLRDGQINQPRGKQAVEVRETRTNASTEKKDVVRDVTEAIKNSCHDPEVDQFCSVKIEKAEMRKNCSYVLLRVTRPQKAL
jgi:hypothetical protein